MAAVFEAAVADTSTAKFREVAQSLGKSDKQVRDLWKKRMHAGLLKVRLVCECD